MAVDITLAVTYFGILLGFGVLVANILEKRKIPDSFFFIILGLILGPTLFNNPIINQYVSIALVDIGAMGPIPDFIRTLAIIMIIFTGTFNLRMAIFKEHYDIALKLAVLGPIISTVILAFAANVIFGLEPVFALLLGAILSGTGDAVIYAFNQNLSKFRSYNIIWIEAILNSPISILLSLMFLSFLTLEPGSLIEPLKYASQFGRLVATGVGTGLIIGFGVAKLLRQMLGEYKPLLVFSIALITFAVAENLGGSGILAVAVCGLIVGNMTFREKEGVKRFDDLLTNLFRISIFTFLGAQAALFVTLNDIILALMFFGIIILARLLIMMTMLGKKRKEMSRRDLALVSLVGTAKGLDAAATAPIVAAALLATDNVGVAASIVNIVIMIILISVLFSSAIAYVLGRKGPEKGMQAVEEKDEDDEEDKDMVDVGKIKKARGRG